MLPQVNAKILKVESLAFTEDQDRDATFAAKWEGEDAAYFREVRGRESRIAGSDVIITCQLIVEVGTPDVEYAEGDQITYRKYGFPDSITGKVKMIERRKIPELMGTTRLSFEEG